MGRASLAATRTASRRLRSWTPVRASLAAAWATSRRPGWRTPVRACLVRSLWVMVCVRACNLRGRVCVQSRGHDR
eukprot:13384225-Alexandrium_andersonii.AAC.1